MVLDSIHNTIIDAPGMGADEAPRLIRNLKTDVDSLQPLWSRVATLGPNSVATAALTLLNGIGEGGRKATNHINAIVEGSERQHQTKDALRQAYIEAAGTVSDFIEASKPVLDLDPTAVADLLGQRAIRRNRRVTRARRDPIPPA